jgi:hypothetical protein
MNMQRWKWFAVFGALALMAVCTPKAHASQTIRRYPLKQHTTFVAGTVDSTAAFSVAGARRVRIWIYSTDVDSTLGAATWPASAGGTSGTGLGLAMDSLTTYVRCISSTVVYGIRSDVAAIDALSIRYAPGFGVQTGLIIDFLPATTAGATGTGGQNVFPHALAKWYTAFKGAGSRATNFNVTAYVYYDNP